MMRVPIGLHMDIGRRAWALGPLALVTALSCAAAVASERLLLAEAADRLDRAEARYQNAKRMKTAIANEQLLHQRVRTTERQLASVWASLRSYDQFTALSVEIADMARQEGLVIPSMTYAVKPEPHDRIAVEATVSFAVSGPYLAVYRFIGRLEAGETYLVIEKLAARRADQKSGEAVTFALTVTTFLRIQEPAGTS
jgi:hypothetical protein